MGEEREVEKDGKKEKDRSLRGSGPVGLT